MGSWPGGWEGGESHKASLPRMPKYLRRGQASGVSSQTTALRCQTRKGGALPDCRQGLHGALHSGGAQRRCRVAQLSQARLRLFSRSCPAGVSWLGSWPCCSFRAPCSSVSVSPEPPSCMPRTLPEQLWPPGLPAQLGPQPFRPWNEVSGLPRTPSYLFAGTFFADLGLAPWRIGCRGPVTFPPTLLLLDLFSSGCWPLRVLSFYLLPCVFQSCQAPTPQPKPPCPQVPVPPILGQPDYR